MHWVVVLQSVHASILFFCCSNWICCLSVTQLVRDLTIRCTRFFQKFSVLSCFKIKIFIQNQCSTPNRSRSGHLNRAKTSHVSNARSGDSRGI